MENKATTIWDIVALNKTFPLKEIGSELYQNLPSVVFGCLKRKLSTVVTELGQVTIFLQMLEVKRSDLEPNVTDEVLNAHVLAAFDGLRGSLKKAIYEHIECCILDKSLDFFDILAVMGSKSSLSLDGSRGRPVSCNLISSIVKSDPRGSRVRSGVYNCQKSMLKALPR